MTRYSVTMNQVMVATATSSTWWLELDHYEPFYQGNYDRTNKHWNVVSIERYTYSIYRCYYKGCCILMESAQWENTSYGKIKNYASFCCHVPSKHTLGTDEDSHGSTYRVSKRVSEWWIWDALSNIVFRLYIIYIIMSRSLIIKHLLYNLKSSRHVVASTKD